MLSGYVQTVHEKPMHAVPEKGLPGGDDNRHINQPRNGDTAVGMKGGLYRCLHFIVYKKGLALRREGSAVGWWGLQAYIG